VTADTDTPEQAEEIDPSAAWDAKRRAWEARREVENRRGAELMRYRERPVVVQGRWGGFKRNRGTASLRARKRQAWAERQR
jgi:hypothetical protein